jgi:hypothetical protein
MNYKGLTKKIFVLLFLFIVLSVVFILQDQGLRTGYFSWLGKTISTIDVFGVFENANLETKLSTSPGLDIFDIRVDNLANDKPEVVEELDIKEVSNKETKKVLVKEDIVIEDQEDPEEVVIPKPILTLDEIKKELDGIKDKLQEIEQEVDDMLALIQIQEQINDIVEEMTEISQEIRSLT